ncbi:MULTISPECIES: MucR family transcriptional regulator [unclassified Methylobacterium]|uniref:MucR family transcriptional regulator n=1 Tax=unclassified Methylobacterium TaxID=2615210 RepID=UPI0024452C55|nr:MULTISPECIES: MucR family transcriptional regulator [unclassified Methylobacterium]
MMNDNGMEPDYIALAAEIVSAFVSKNSVPVPELNGLIVSVHTTLAQLGNGAAAEKVEPPTPAVSIKRSVTPDFIICLEDGKKFKSLKRHLRTRYDMTPDAYRTKWNLAADYPMVAPNYAAARSELAKTMGLGQQRRKTRGKAAPEAAAASAPRRSRGRSAAEG